MPQIARLSILALLVALSGCAAFSQPRTAASCSGPSVVMNPDKWTPTAEELR